MSAAKTKPTAEDARAVLKAQPLVGLTKAAELLEMAAPNVSRMMRQGKMVEPIPVEGAASVFLRSEVMELRKRIRRERAAREKARA